MNKLLEKPDFHVACAEYAELDRAWNSALFSPVSRYIPWTRLYFPLSGEGKIEFNGKTTIMKRGKLILVPPCAKIHVSCDDFLNKFWIHFSAQSFKHGTELFSLFDDVAVLDLNSFTSMNRCSGGSVVVAGVSCEHTILNDHTAYSGYLEHV